MMFNKLFVGGDEWRKGEDTYNHFQTHRKRQIFRSIMTSNRSRKFLQIGLKSI